MNRVGALVERRAKLLEGNTWGLDLSPPGRLKTVVSGRTGLVLSRANLVVQRTGAFRLRAAWDALFDAVGPGWPKNRLTDALLGNTKDGHINRRARFSLTVFLVLNGASPEVVYEFYAAAQLLEGGDKASLVRWIHAVSIMDTIRCGKPLTAFDVRLGARVCRGEYTCRGKCRGQDLAGGDGRCSVCSKAEPWVAQLEREAYDAVGKAVDVATFI